MKRQADGRLRRKSGRGLGMARLREMIEEATVDAYGESEQLVGFYSWASTR